MHLRYRSVLSLVAICTALAVAPAFAAKPAPIAMPTPTGSVGHITYGPNSTTAFPCKLGIDGPAANAFGYVFPPDDEYFTLLNPATCDPCPGAAYRANAAHVWLYYTASCQIPVTISLVPAHPTASPGCFQPNPFDPPLCAPVQYLLSDGGNLNACLDYTLPLGQDCCFQGPVFLKIVFDQGTCPNFRPAFCGPGGPCVNCQQWNYYPGTSAPGDELCSLLGAQGYTGFIMNADVSCCQVVPTLPGSWGKIKTIYR